MGNWCSCRTQTDTWCLFEFQTEMSCSFGVYQTDTRYPFQLGRTSLLHLNYIVMLNHWGIHKLTRISLYYLPYTNKTFVDALIASLSYYHLLKMCHSSIRKWPIFLILKPKSTNVMSCWQLAALIEGRAGNGFCWYKFKLSQLKIGSIHAWPLFMGSCLADQPVTDPTMCFKMRPMIICSNCNLGLNCAFEWNLAPQSDDFNYDTNYQVKMSFQQTIHLFYLTTTLVDLREG